VHIGVESADLVQVLEGVRHSVLITFETGGYAIDSSALVLLMGLSVMGFANMSPGYGGISTICYNDISIFQNKARFNDPLLRQKMSTFISGQASYVDHLDSGGDPVKRIYAYDDHASLDKYLTTNTEVVKMTQKSTC
jgi:hypothetical protein